MSKKKTGEGVKGLLVTSKKTEGVIEVRIENTQAYESFSEVVVSARGDRRNPLHDSLPLQTLPDREPAQWFHSIPPKGSVTVAFEAPSEHQDVFEVRIEGIRPRTEPDVSIGGVALRVPISEIPEKTA